MNDSCEWNRRDKGSRSRWNSCTITVCDPLWRAAVIKYFTAAGFREILLDLFDFVRAIPTGCRNVSFSHGCPHQEAPLAMGTLWCHIACLLLWLFVVFFISLATHCLRASSTRVEKLYARCTFLSFRNVYFIKRIFLDSRQREPVSGRCSVFNNANW